MLSKLRSCNEMENDYKAGSQGRFDLLVAFKTYR